jgi:hypothetical protein
MINPKMNSSTEKITHKKCSKCQEVKLLADFHKNKRMSLGVESRCRSCAKENAAKPEVKARKKERNAEYYAKPEVKARIKEHNAKPEVKTRAKEYNAEYYAKPEIKARRKEYMAEYRAKPESKARRKETDAEYKAKPEVKARTKEYNAEYYAKPETKARKKEYNAKPESKARQREYHAKYHAKPETKARAKEYYAKPEAKAKRNARLKERYDSEKNIKLTVILRSRQFQVLKGKSKSASAIKLLGCTVDEALQHLENQFQPGMTWDNWSLDGWHVDHIKPCASFDMEDEEQQKECFHWSNLQPLWGIDNIKKGDKLNYTHEG